MSYIGYALGKVDGFDTLFVISRVSSGRGWVVFLPITIGGEWERVWSNPRIYIFFFPGENLERFPIGDVVSANSGNTPVYLFTHMYRSYLLNCRQ